MHVRLFLGIGPNLLINLSFLYQNHAVFIKIVLYYSLKGRDGESSRFFFSFSRIVLVILDFFFLPYEVVSSSFKVLKYVMEFLMWISMKLYISFGKMSISWFSFLFLLFQYIVHDHGWSLHFLMASSMSFFRNFKFLPYQEVKCLVWVASKCFKLFSAIVKEVVSLFFC